MPHIFVCVKVLGQDFLTSSSHSARLSCRLRSLSSPTEAGLWTVEARPLSDKLVECLLNRPLSGDGSTIAAALSPVILEVRLANKDDQLFSNEVFLTLFNSSCVVCPEGRMPQHPTVCPARADVCVLEDDAQCVPAGSRNPQQPCLHCSQGHWQKRDIGPTEPLFSENEVEIEFGINFCSSSKF